MMKKEWMRFVDGDACRCLIRGRFFMKLRDSEEENPNFWEKGIEKFVLET